MTQTIIINTDQFPIKTNHICFKASESEDTISLWEIVENVYLTQKRKSQKYRATIGRIETKHIITEKKNSQRASFIHLVKYANDNAKIVLR